jgi:UDP-3-O-[3-hydroxymyristoyl] glucosamine N-acyltransferase
MAQSGVTKDVVNPGVYFGTPSQPQAEFARDFAAVRRLAKQRRHRRDSEPGA